MRWHILTAAAALSLAVATPSFAGSSAGPAFLQVAQNNDAHPNHRDERRHRNAKQKARQQHHRVQRQQRRIERNRKTLNRQHRRIQNRNHRLNNQHRKIDRRSRHLNRQRQKIENRRNTLHRQNRRLRQNRRELRHHRRYDWNHYRIGHRPGDWDRHHFDRHAWERNFYAHRRYRWHAYHRPPGWYYRRWTYGMVFPRAFWGRRHWINSYWQFGLENPPYGYVWVRYGPDAMLVNVEDGRILRVVYNLYY